MFRNNSKAIHVSRVALAKVSLKNIQSFFEMIESKDHFIHILFGSNSQLNDSKELDFQILSCLKIFSLRAASIELEVLK